MPPVEEIPTKVRLPAIRTVDKMSKLAILRADAEKQVRMTPGQFPLHNRPLLLASEMHAAQREEKRKRAEARREARAAEEARKAAAAAAAAGQDAAGQAAAAAAALEVAKKKEALKKSAMVMQAQEAINNKFKDMFKAFQYMDLDRSGTLNEKELAQALDMLNVPLDRSKLREIIEACDKDGDGGISYKEFVDVLARDTVTLAAMGKRGMQAMEAMGDDGMGIRGTVKNVKATLNKNYDDVMAGPAVEATAAEKMAMLKQAQDVINAKFTNMRKAFYDMDLDMSGTLDAKELWRAFDRFNLQMDKSRFQAIIDACDKDGDGGISYNEFVDVLARDTVTLAAIGKRDMTSMEAFGVPDLDKEFLGHKHIKNVKASINNLDFE